MVWKDERTAGDIAARFDVSFAAVSQHLGVLRDHQLVRVRRDGRRRLYRADRRALGELRPVLERMWRDTLDRLAELAAEEESKA